MKKKIVIVFGGKSVEHEISIISAVQVMAALDLKKYDYYPVLLTKTNEFISGPGFSKMETFRQGIKKYRRVYFYTKGKKVYLKGVFGPISKPIDAALLVVHGKNVEDGNLYGYFKTLGLPCTSCDCLAASIFQNKLTTKIMLSSENIEVLPYTLIKEEEWKYSSRNKLQELQDYTYPLMIKSPCLGSSIGVYKANTPKEANDAIIEAFRYDKQVIIEKCLKNFKEYNQAALVGEDVITSLIEEVVSTNSFLTFDDKYTQKENTTKRIIDPAIPEELRERITALTRKIVSAFSVKSVIRIDYLLDVESNKLYVNEVNTIPGSLAYYLFEDMGIYFSDLLDKLISSALREKYKEDLKITSFKSNVLSSTINK